MKPLMVYEETIPSSHRMMRIMAMVYNMPVAFGVKGLRDVCPGGAALPGRAARNRSIHVSGLQIILQHRAIPGGNDDFANVGIVIGISQLGGPEMDFPHRRGIIDITSF